MRPEIDRAAFVSLTFAMAGLACNTGPSPTVAGVIEIPRQPPQPADAGAPPRPHEDEAAKLRAAPPETASDDDDEAPTAPQAEGGVVAIAHGTGCGWVDPASVRRPSGACSDDRGAAGACTSMKACKGFAFPKQKCEAYRRYFKPKVAERALACLSKLSDKQACDACNAYRCGDLAMKSSCPDASVAATCVQIASKCKSVAVDECKTYLSGLNAAGRAKVTSCLTGGSGCSFGIFSCAEGLF